jgi:chromosome segregation ATPase
MTLTHNDILNIELGKFDKDEAISILMTDLDAAEEELEELTEALDETDSSVNVAKLQIEDLEDAIDEATEAMIEELDIDAAEAGEVLDKVRELTNQIFVTLDTTT